MVAVSFTAGVDDGLDLIEVVHVRDLLGGLGEPHGALNSASHGYRSAKAWKKSIERA
jgi:hypothetical protein